MELKLQLGIFMLFIQVSLAVWQHVTVFKGQTLDLSCPITEADNVDWKNPDGYIMFFNHNKGFRDKRYSIVKLSKSEFTISISSVTFKDGGNYTCSQYGLHTTEKKVEVTVLGHPKMTVTKHAGKFVVKCTAEGNHYPPQISWKLNHGPEFLKDAHSQSLLEDKKYISTDILHLFSVETRVTVKCLLRHPALHSKTQMNFVKIGRDSTKSTTMTSPPTSQPQGSTEVLRTRHGRTTASLTTRDVHRPSSESSVKLSTVPSNQLFSSNEPSEASRTSVLSDSTRTRNQSISNATSTTGWTSVSETKDETIFNNRTEGNKTVSSNDQEMRIANKGSSSLLVFLVTCLIFALLVVVIFFAIKLRRAHITWKKENEDSDPSEESSKSKSSQEEKNSQGQRRRGLFNTAFTQYVVEEPTVITSVINTGAMTATERTNKEQTSQPQTQAQTSARHDIKETEL